MNIGLLLLDPGVVRRVFQPSHPKRLAFFLLADSMIACGALAAAFLIRFDFALGVPYYRLILSAAPLFITVKLGSFAFFRLYRMSWRFVSLRDTSRILRAVLFAELAIAVVIYAIGPSALVGFPRGVLLIDGVLTLVFVATLRIAKRMALEVFRGSRATVGGRRTVIIGAGNTGEMVLRDIQRTQYERYDPVVFLDDDPHLVGSSVHGIPVAGRLDALADVSRRFRATAVIIAIQSLGHQQLRALYNEAHAAGAQEVKIVPRLYDVHQPQIRLQAIEDIKIEDLIRRQAVRVDDTAIGAALRDRRVLITGAAGSIGFEIIQQVCRFAPRELICFEIDETDLHRVELTLQRCFPDLFPRIRFVVGDVRDADRVDAVFARHRPEVVYHAAAYKHVPMMEYNPSEAVKVNIIGTWHVARAAHGFGAERFVLISTDKAVRPTSVMGATKRVAEYICQAYETSGRTAFIVVRFGNVLGSRGSVLPIFMEQLQRGGPLTITHAGMQRYFMTIPEAVALVLQAGVLGRGGEVMALDMGDPVRIVDLAEEFIRLHRLRPHVDIAIEYIGMRPGEKLFEELLTAEEGTAATRHEKIFVARSPERWAFPEAEERVRRFEVLARHPDTDGHAIRACLRECVRWYDGGTTTTSAARMVAGVPAEPIAASVARPFALP